MRRYLLAGAATLVLLGPARADTAAQVNITPRVVILNPDGSIASFGGTGGGITVSPGSCSITPTIVSGTGGTLVAANANRKSLRWMNVGAADVTVAPGTSAPVVGQGMVYASTAAGKQGGSETLNDPAVAINAFAYAAATTATIAVWECQ